MSRIPTFEEASHQAATLRKQGMTYPKIAEHLDRQGYISPKTRGRIGEQTVRNMINRLEKSEGATKEDVGAPETDLTPDVITVRTPNMEVVEALRKIPALGLSAQLTLKLVNTLLEGL